MAAAHAGGREEEEGSDACGELKSQKDVAGVVVWLEWSEWNHVSSHGKWEPKMCMNPMNGGPLSIRGLCSTEEFWPRRVRIFSLEETHRPETGRVESVEGTHVLLLA